MVKCQECGNEIVMVENSVPTAELKWFWKPLRKLRPMSVRNVTMN